MSLTCKILTLLFMIFISMEVSASDPDKGIASVCANYEKVSEILIPYTEEAWTGISATPAGPVPTVTFMTIAARQPILDFCRFITQLKMLTGAEAIFKTMEYGNLLLGNQFDEHIGFMRETYDLGVALDKFSQGDRDISKAQGLHRRINSYLRSSDKFINGENANTFESRGERERKMALMVRSANKIATFKSATNCAEPNIEQGEKNTEYFEKEVRPLYNLIDEKTEEVDYYLKQLQQFGIYISTGYEDNNLYQKRLFGLYSKAVKFNRSAQKFKMVKSYSQTKELKMVKKGYYSYSVLIKSEDFNEFKKLYNGHWKDYTIRFVRLRGFANGPITNVERSFRDSISYECRRNKIEWNLRRSNPNLRYEEAGSARFTAEVDRKVAECREGKVINGKTVEGLLAYYVDELRNNLVQLKNYQAVVWNYESEFLGVNRSITETPQASDFGELTQEEVACEKTLNIGESTLLQTKMNAEELELRAMMAEEMTKKSLVEESIQMQKKEKLEKSKREYLIEKESRKRVKDISEDLTMPSADGIGF